MSKKIYAILSEKLIKKKKKKGLFYYLFSKSLLFHIYILCFLFNIINFI